MAALRLLVNRQTTHVATPFTCLLRRSPDFLWTVFFLFLLSVIYCRRKFQEICARVCADESIFLFKYVMMLYASCKKNVRFTSRRA